MTGHDDMNGPEAAMSADEMLAMDFAIGALDRNDRRAVELRLRSDPGFRALVEDWQAQLSPLDAETAPQVPPPAVWAAIAAEIAPVRAAVPVATARPGLWNSLMLWRGVAFAGVAAAAIALVPAAPPVLPVASAPAAPAKLLVAAMAGSDGTPLLSAAYDPLRGAVVLTPATKRDDEGKSAELWVIQGKNPPRSLGVIDIQGPNEHVIPAEKLKGLSAGDTLAISIEPDGGSPTGLPTGPVVATGKLTEV